MQMLDLRSSDFRRAIINIERRAERELIDENLVRTFVPNRVLEELDTPSNQLLFGRRGVGKTHTLKSLLGKLTAERGHLCSYIDCTSFGSGIGNEGTSLNVALKFFSGFLKALSISILDYGVVAELPREGLQDLVLACAARIEQLATPRDDGPSFDYSSIIAAINEFLAQMQCERLFIILDEWANIPKLSQPYFAEFLKRAFFANKLVTVKLGVVDYTYSLNTTINGQQVGLERSADIFSDVRMDRFFVWDQHVEFVEQFFAEVIFNHLALELGLNLSTTAQEKAAFVANLFTQGKVFSEMCRASEGNTRDLLVLLVKAHLRFTQQNTHQRIALEDIQGAAVDLYRADKLSNLASETELEEFLQYLVKDLIKDRRSRTFMVAYEQRMHPVLSRLFSARLLHPLDVEWSHPDRPGERYSLITMDYGSYVSFRGTQNDPYQKVFWAASDVGKDELTDLVPLDDRRSIRRIVLDVGILDGFLRKWKDGTTQRGTPSV